MKKVSLFALVLLLVASFTSCNKTDATKGIAFGDNSKMEITTYDTIAEYYFNKELDVDGDGYSDLLLTLDQPGAASTGHHTRISIKCKPGTGLLGETIDQKRYIHFETTYNTSDDGSVVVTEYDKYYTCNMMSESDSIYLEKDYFLLFANDKGDIFRLDNNYLDTEATIYEDSYEAAVGYEEPVNDTATFWKSHYLNDCENFPLDTPKYIGFKLTTFNTNKTRLGWVKIKIGQNSIELIETAIQK